MKQEKNNKEFVDDKSAKQQIRARLEQTFATLVPLMGEKKFHKRIKKAGKILSGGLNGNTKHISFKPVKTKSAVLDINAHE